MYDGDIDLKLPRDSAYVIVQCKRWNAMKVPHNDVRELIGVMVNERATGAVLVTCGEFIQAASAAAARQSNVQLVDGVTVRQWPEFAALEAEKVRHTADMPCAVDSWGEVFAERRAPACPAPARHGDDRRVPIVAIVAVVAVVALAAVLVFAFIAKQQRGTIAGGSARSNTTTPAPLPPHIQVKPNGASRAPASAGNVMAASAPVTRAAIELLRQAATPDVERPIDREAARTAAKTVTGVRSALWLNHDNFVVMVGGPQYRSMAMIDQVCIALAPLGETLG